MNNLKRYRQLADLSQEEIAAMMGCTQGCWGHWENGRRKPSMDDGRKIVTIFRFYGVDCSLNDVFPWPASEFVSSLDSRKVTNLTKF